MIGWLETNEFLIANTIIYSIASLSLYFSFRCGVFNLSTAGVMALGAYGTGVLVVKEGWATAPALLAGTVIGTLGAAMVALPVVRLRGHFLAIATLAFAAVVAELATTFTDLTGGAAGLVGIAGDVSLVVLLAMLAAVLYLAFVLRRHRVGRAWDAIRIDEAAAAAAGVNVVRFKLLAFAVSTVLAALAGGLFALINFVIVPSLFGFQLLTNLLVYTLLGGIGNPLGPVAGASILSTMPTWLSEAGAYLDYITGALLILVVTYASGGLVQLTQSVTRPLRRLLRGRGPRPRTRAHPAEPEPPAQPARDREVHLVVERLTKLYGGVKSLDEVSFDVRSGETVALIGPNGAGKTTLLNCISGLVRRTSGEITLDGRRIDGWAPHDLAHVAGIRRTFQTPRVLPGMSVMANVLLGLHADIEGGLLSAVSRWPSGRRSEQEARARAREALRQVALSGAEDTIASELPYGMQRRVELARALIARPSILLLDEPVAGLSSDEAEELKEILRGLAERTGCAVIFVDHNMPFVIDLAQRIVVLNFGRLLASGTPAEIQRNREVVEAYLGDSESRLVHK